MRIHLDNCCLNRPFDDRLLQLARKQSDLNIQVLTPLEVIQKVGP
jgi:hypothetical protein